MMAKDMGSKKHLLDSLVSYLDYDKDTGDLIWKKSPHRAIKPGTTVSKSVGSGGHLKVCFKDNNFQQHRVIFYILNGFIPDIVDHIDGNRLNNRPDNLRAALPSNNSSNQKLSAANKSGYKGVLWHKQSRKWSARIGKNRKIIYVGMFDNKHIAAHEYNKAAIKYHGEFSTLNPVGGMFI